MNSMLYEEPYDFV